MNRRQLLRNALFGAAAAAAPPLEARHFPADFDESKKLAQADWKPVFLSEHQNKTLLALCDLIIPETDTPGARTAFVNRFLDVLLAAETYDVQQSFLNSLAYIDGAAQNRYGNAFIYIPSEDQVELLEFYAYPDSLETWGEGKAAEQPGHRHFENLKGWISRVFFNSEAGMKALGWNGEPSHGVLTGCEVKNA